MIAWLLRVGRERLMWLLVWACAAAIASVAVGVRNYAAKQVFAPPEHDDDDDGDEDPEAPE